MSGKDKTRSPRKGQILVENVATLGDSRVRHCHEERLMFVKRIDGDKDALWVLCLECEYEHRAGEAEARGFER